MKKQRSEFFRLIVFIIWGIYLLIFVLVFIWRDDWKRVNNNRPWTWDSLETWNSLITWNIETENSNVNITWEIIQPNNTPWEIFEMLVSNWCNVSWMNSITIASENDRFYTTEPPKVSTKKIKTHWDLWNIFLCIVPDVSNKKESYNQYRKNYSYNAVTFIKVWDYEGFYDVGYSLESALFYDLDSNNSKRVTKNIRWKYRTHELPLLQVIDVLENVILADTSYWWTKQVNLSAEFKDWKSIDIWAYMTKLWNEAFRASSIKEFKIVWDWAWYIELIN